MFTPFIVMRCVVDRCQVLLSLIVDCSWRRLAIRLGLHVHVNNFISWQSIDWAIDIWMDIEWQIGCVEEYRFWMHSIVSNIGAADKMQITNNIVVESIDWLIIVLRHGFPCKSLSYLQPPTTPSATHRFGLFTINNIWGFLIFMYRKPGPSH